MVSPKDLPAGRRGPAKTSKTDGAPASNGDEAPATAAPSGDAEGLVVVTLRMSDGSIVTIEAADSGGARHELTAAEAARLLADGRGATMKGLVHEAFEAGIACILDESLDEAADEASGESREDALLHDELLDSLIERSPAKRLLRRDVLNSALLGTIISEASIPPPPAAGA
jgi:hypothetical protein